MKIIFGLPVVLLLIFLSRAAAASEQIMVPVDYRGGRIELAGWFDKPGGRGPFPVVIGLHSCSAFDANMDRGSLPLWLSLLQQQGYATFKFDSFTARGYREVCGTNAVTAAERAGDVLQAAYLLAGRPDVRPDRIAVIGFSHGGGTAVYVARDYPALRPLRTRLGARGGKLAASVGVYPDCGKDPYHNPVVVPLLALSGGSDDWSPAARCVALKDANPAAPITVEVYPGAFHAFDVERRARYELGHRLAYDPAATADAHTRGPAFLYRYLHWPTGAAIRGGGPRR